MARITVSAEFPATVHEAESCWYDTAGWPAWVEGLEHVQQTSPTWPGVGAEVRWRSGPAGRGEVVERVIAHQPLQGQTIALKDAQMEGEQSVAFSPLDESHVVVELALDYRLRRRTPFTPLVDPLFIRPALRHSLQSTLARFGHRLAARQ